MKDYDLTNEEIAVWNGFNSFKSHFRRYIISRLKDKSDIWEPHFRKALYESSQDYWEKNTKYISQDNLIEFIDFSHFKELLKNKPKIFESILNGNVDLLKNWVYEIINVRNKIAHVKPSSQEINKAWKYMEELAIAMNDKDFENELKEKKNKLGKPDKKLEEKIKREILEEINKNQSINTNINTNTITITHETKKDGIDKNIILIVGAFLLVVIVIVFILKSEQRDIVITNNNQSPANNITTVTPSSTLIHPIVESDSHHQKFDDSEKDVISSEHKQIEDYNEFVNSSLTNSANNTEVSVIIIDDKTNTIETSVSTAVADIYSKAGKIGNTGLLRSSFIKKPEFQELFEGNSDIIEKLKLQNYVDYLIIGKITFTFHPDIEVNRSIICNAALSVSVISTATKELGQNNFYNIGLIV